MKNLIKLERARNNITQADLADMVKVSRQTINSIETGRFIPSALLAFKIAHVLQSSVDEIFQLEESDWSE
ncbi:helix-turn-helix transcriptional regulator [Dyadobacter pollutisoli]|jgi:putative transcriptional regulator|uniref:Helix-turn-helix transcriptional regulator n=1 Tax=Dyadobacter pollutisoli TaxID=2910158 RepID=A0A9E8NDI7_9BACT|nr:helix-turn-helix transcriptional regulator [Dyadobacter pollutisoli]WAC13012.1 helix-turn-helix transcriptional regulator [Dyadobacter pollutisoli]